MSEDKPVDGGELPKTRRAKAPTAARGGAKPQVAQATTAPSVDGGEQPPAAAKRARSPAPKKAKAVSAEATTTPTDKVRKRSRKADVEPLTLLDAQPGIITKGQETENSIAPALAAVARESEEAPPSREKLDASMSPDPPGRRPKTLVLKWLARASQGVRAWFPRLAANRLGRTISHGQGGAPLGAPPSHHETAAVDQSTFVPEAVHRRFLRVEHDYYFPDQTLAFSDRGKLLATRRAHPEVVSALIDIARARGWTSITVKGSEEFRRSAWKEAALHGVAVVGYEPSKLELAWLARRPATNSLERTSTKKNSAVKGIDKARKKAAAPHAPGPATTKIEEPSPASSLVDPELEKKAAAFRHNKPTFVVKKYPELVGAYGLVEAGRAFAADKLPAAVRDEFIGLVQRHVVQEILSGNTISGPQIFVTGAKPGKHSEQARASTHQAREREARPPRNDLGRER